MLLSTAGPPDEAELMIVVRRAKNHHGTAFLIADF
jgi:hypothetical protein